MISRRKIAQFAPMLIAVGALAACATGNIAPNGTSNVAVPTVVQVQAWVSIINSELPAFLAESETSGLLTGTNDIKAKQALVTFQALATQFTSPTFDVKNTAVIVSEIGTALNTILAVIPQTAPYVGLIQLGVLMVSGLIASFPVAIPALPSAATVASMHKDTLRFHKK